MQIEWQEGLAARVVSGRIKGTGWGAETADRASFFTLTDRPYGCDIRTTNLSSIQGGFARQTEVVMAEGHWLLDMALQHDGTMFRVEQTLHCIEDSLLQDFVVRFKFDRSAFDAASIGGRTVKHMSRNVWHQYPVHHVTLHGPHGTAEVSLFDAITCDRFLPHIYVRDEPGSWIVHVRLIPSEPCDLYWIRWANRFFSVSLGDHWSRRLLKWGWLKKKLWYLAERRGGRPALQAQGLARLRRGDTIGIRAGCEIRADEYSR